VPTYEAAVRYAAAGLGLCTLPLGIAHPLATSLKLKLIAIEADWSKRHYAICFRDQVSLTPVTRQLIDHLSRRSRQRAVYSAEPGL
jgi:DNA-binding transcriptional LysR family regulator